MEFFISTGDAQRAIKLLSVTAKVNVTSFEGQILIQASDKQVTFTSRNASSGLSCSFPAKIEEEGQANVLYSKMKSFIMTAAPWDGEVGAKEFHFKVMHPKLKIAVETFFDESTSTKNNLKLDQIKASSFLSPVKMEESNIIVNSTIIKTAIDKASYAIDPHGSSLFTKGLRMVLKDGKISFTATDGKVISEYKVQHEVALEDGEYFLPHEFLMGMRRILTDDEKLFFDVTKQKIKISFDNVMYWANGLSYDKWPATDEVWKQFDKTVEVRREVLLSGIQSFVDILDPDDYYRVTVEKKDKKLSLVTDSSLFEYPEMEASEDFVVDINGMKFISSLSSLSEDIIKLKCLNSKNGIILEAEGFDNQKAFITNLNLKKRT